MKYLKLYKTQTEAVGQTINTPNIVILSGMSKVLYVPTSAGSTVELIEDDDFVTYLTDDSYSDIMYLINLTHDGTSTTESSSELVNKILY